MTLYSDLNRQLERYLAVIELTLRSDIIELMRGMLIKEVVFTSFGFLSIFLRSLQKAHLVLSACFHASFLVNLRVNYFHLRWIQRYLISGDFRLSKGRFALECNRIRVVEAAFLP